MHKQEVTCEACVCGWQESDAIFLVAPTAGQDKIPFGYVGKMNYIPASLWENEVKRIWDDKAPKECGT